MVTVGFCGSRSLPPSFAPLVGRAVRQVLQLGWSVSVGCAAGADLLVRSAAPGASVFSVAGGAFGSGRSAFAARSAALVRSVAGGGGSFVGFVSGPCPAGVLPGRSWSSGSSVSGSWSSLALAAGLGCSVFVFWCAPGAPVLPSWVGGCWSPSSSGLFVGAWQWVPASAQLSLF